ncbi:hypothetical protein Trydic_g19037 [Trypoxylus dichotomus]
MEARRVGLFCLRILSQVAVSHALCSVCASCPSSNSDVVPMLLPTFVLFVELTIFALANPGSYTVSISVLPPAGSAAFSSQAKTVQVIDHMLFLAPAPKECESRVMGSSAVDRQLPERYQFNLECRRASVMSQLTRVPPVRLFAIFNWSRI